MKDMIHGKLGAFFYVNVDWCSNIQVQKNLKMESLSERLLHVSLVGVKPGAVLPGPREDKVQMTKGEAELTRTMTHAYLTHLNSPKHTHLNTRIRSADRARGSRVSEYNLIYWWFTSISHMVQVYEP